jgi:hypothetical protein
VVECLTVFHHVGFFWFRFYSYTPGNLVWRIQMLKKKAVSRSPKGDIKNKGSAPPKRANAKGSNLRAMSGPSAKTAGKTTAHKKTAGKTTAHKPTAASTTKPKAVQPPTTRNHRRPAMPTPGSHTALKAAPVLQYDRFSNLLTELADSRLSKTESEIAFMGLYYGPPSNPNDVFMLWVTRESSGGRFKADPILEFIKSPNQTVALNEGQSFIQHVVDVETLSSILKKGVSGNHPDADVINSIIEAIRAERYHILLPKNPSNPVRAVADALVPLTMKLATRS